MFGPEEGGVTETPWSGKMSASDHNNQFPCALSRVEFRFDFAQWLVLKRALLTEATWSGISSAPDLFFHFGFGGLGAKP